MDHRFIELGFEVIFVEIELEGCPKESLMMSWTEFLEDACLYSMAH